MGAAHVHIFVICAALLSLANSISISFYEEALFYFPWGYNRKALHIDPEVDENVTQIVKSHGLDVQEHYVGTLDGYILCLIRVRNLARIQTNGSKVVFLQHGLLDSSHTWVNNLRNQSLAFILADAGFDVWLGNSRGSTYSRRHRFLRPDEVQFWDFSWDDMAEYDLPAALYYVLKQTGVEKLGYVGHSQGCQIALAQFDKNPDLQSRINVFVALAPAAFLGHVESPVRYIAPYARTVEHVWKWFGHGEFFPSTVLLRFLARFLCREDHVPSVCSNAIFLFAGFDRTNMNITRLPVYIAHTPAGTSVQNIVHYCQAMLSNQFQRFDYGEPKNMEKYGQKTPPSYDLSNITIPIVVYHGGNDWLAVPTDVLTLLNHIAPAVVKRYFLPNYNHLDFVWGVNAAELVYPTVVEHLSTY